MVAPRATPAKEEGAKKDDPGVYAGGGGGGPATPYNPYPPGILPADVSTEIARVQREVNVIFQQAVAESKALPARTVTGQPPTVLGSGYREIQTLGKLMNFDLNMGVLRNQACASCHMPYSGFSGPIPSVNLTMVAFPGSFQFRAGKRTAQRYTYAPWYPVLQLNVVGKDFFGGNFWDGRATGFLIQNPDAEQAQHPPVDTQEMGLPDTACIAFRLSQAQYLPLFEQIWGVGSITGITFPANTEAICATPGGAAVFGTDTQPVKLSPADRTRANTVYDRWGQSLDAFEKGPEVSPFSSKFDNFMKALYTLTPDEAAGYALFHGKANCNACHIDGRGTTIAAGQTDTSKRATTNPLFTCFGFNNEGLPINPRDAIYYQTTPDFFGFTPNPFGFGYRDLGLGTFLRSGFGAAPNPNATWIPFAPTSDGFFQVSTARNVGLAPPQCPTTEAPGPYFQKGFFHNGYIKSLKQLVTSTIRATCSPSR
jgi:cytochrome c peroxidase